MPLRSKLPAPPGKGRPLPPEPARSMDDAPPPLPSRPGKPNLPKIPPPKQTDNQHCDDGDEYLEPEDWTSSAPPKIPPKNFTDISELIYVPTPECSDDDDCETYEEPNEPPSIPRHPPPAPQEQETYDDFEGMGTPGQADDDPGETYDACDVQTQPHSNDYAEDNIYEEGDVLPDPPDGELYEFMPEETTPAAPAKPPHHMSPGHAPSLPSRPPPSRQNDYDSGQDTPDPPGRPTAKIASVKRLSGEGQKSLGISLHELGARKANLKKVESTEDREQKVESPIEPSTGNMVKDRINKFKQAEKGIKPGITSPKPLLPVKPMATIHSTPKPSEAVKSPPPPTVVHKRDTSPPLPPPPNVDNFEESDDIYDEGFSYVPDPLSREEWYHGEIERNESTKKLQSIGQDGTFLVRKSKQGGDTQPYTLVVLYLGHVYNLKMRQRSDGQIALGESKPDELAFKDVPALIQHHKSHDVILVNVKDNKQHKTLLKKHPIAK